MIVNNLFWGILILLLGLSIIIKALFGLHFPIFKLLFGVLLIYLGFSVIFDIHRDGRSKVKFGSVRFHDVHPARNYTVVFGEGTIDLSSIDRPEKPIYVKANTVFGKSEIILNKDIPTQITLNAVLAEANMPYGIMNQTGNNTYALGDKDPLMNLEVNVVFGKTTVRTADENK